MDKEDGRESEQKRLGNKLGRKNSQETAVEGSNEAQISVSHEDLISNLRPLGLAIYDLWAAQTPYNELEEKK